MWEELNAPIISIPANWGWWLMAIQIGIYLFITKD